jgi:ABC-type oligopeptide transport system substrate-binding subunit
MKRVLVTILALALVVGLMAGCSAGAKGGELNWNIGSAGPKTIDPGLCGASDGGDVINNTFEGLIREKKWCCAARYCKNMGNIRRRKNRYLQSQEIKMV